MKCTLVLAVAVLVCIAFTEAQTTTPPQPTPSPDFDCPDREDRFFPHPTDCTQYFHCTNGLAWLMKCATPLYFNPKTSLCDFPHNVDCTPANH